MLFVLARRLIWLLSRLSRERQHRRGIFRRPPRKHPSKKSKMSLGSASEVATAIVAFAAFAFGFYTFSRMKTASDVETVLSIFDRINGYWDTYLSDDAKRHYCLGQILSYFENACFLANQGVISDKAFSCVSDHIFEVWTKINADEGMRADIESYISAPTTFCEIKSFVSRRRHSPLSWRRALFEIVAVP